MAKNYMIQMVLPFLFSIFIIVYSSGASESYFAFSDNMPKDSTKSSKTVDSLKKSSSDSTSNTVKKDTVKPFIPMHRHGSIFLLSNPTFEEITKHDILFDVYNGMYELMQRKLDAYPLYLGAPGLNSSFSMFGGRAKDNAVMFNGIPYADLAYSSINIDQFSTEFMEKAEVLTGSDAAIFSDDAQGMLINFQEVRYDIAKPYTKLWYEQAGYEFTAADGIYSHNILKNTNFTFGFRKVTSKGRFPNSWADDWNIRSLFRWNINERTSLSLVENFVNQGNGLNGGVNPDRSSAIFDELSAVPYFDSNNERNFRHYLTSTLTSYLDKDTTQAISIKGFYSYSEWRRYRSADQVLDTNLASTNILALDRQYGVNLRYESNLLNFATLRFGADFINYNLNKTDYNDPFNGFKTSYYAQAVLSFPGFIVSGGSRLTLVGSKQLLTVGGKIVSPITKSFSVFGDISVSEKSPTPAQSLILNKERHFLVLGGLDWKNSLFNIKINVFNRTIQNEIISGQVYDTLGNFVNTYSYNANGVGNILGGNLNLETRIFSNIFIALKGEGNFVSVSDGNNNEKYPKILGSITTYYEILKGQSILNIGLSYEMASKFKGETYYPMTREYYDNPYSSTNSLHGLDIFVSARLGNAYVRLMYENILSSGYYYVPYYPVYDANFRLMVSWAFLN